VKDKREDIEVCNSRRSDSCRVIARPDQGRVTHYKLAFENEWVQFVDVHYGPHEKSRMAEHPGGVVVVLTEGHLKFTDQNGKVQEVHAKPGESRWFPPFGHPVENLGRYRLQRGLPEDQDQRSIGQAEKEGVPQTPDTQTERT